MLPRTKKEVDAWLDKMLRDFCRDWAEKEEKLKKKAGHKNENICSIGKMGREPRIPCRENWPTYRMVSQG
jgi:hypothetical protein